jgi:hypothetical protein
MNDHMNTLFGAALVPALAALAHRSHSSGAHATIVAIYRA